MRAIATAPVGLMRLCRKDIFRREDVRTARACWLLVSRIDRRGRTQTYKGFLTLKAAENNRLGAMTPTQGLVQWLMRLQ